MFDDFDTGACEDYYDDSMRQDEMDTAEDYNRWEEQQVFLDNEGAPAGYDDYPSEDEMDREFAVNGFHSGRDLGDENK